MTTKRIMSVPVGDALIGRVVSTVLKIGIGFAIGVWIFIAAMG